MPPVIVLGGALDAAGPVAREIAALWWLMLILGGAGFLVFAAILGRGLLRPRGATELRPPPEKPRDQWRLILWAGVVMPLVVIVVIFGFTVDVMRAVPSSGGRGALVVEVVGHQWWWELRYPREGVTTANELHVPVGRRVELRLTSADVIHSFWAPRLGGKLDLLPEDRNVLVLQADEPGEYQGACAEFCGLQHANMRFLVVAEPEEDFAAWLAAQRRAAVEPSDEATRRGQQVFLSAGCAACHTVAGTPAGGTRGPDLTHVASRRILAAGRLRNTTGQLRAWVEDPQQLKPGAKMPAADLDEQELEAVVRYLRSLR